MARRQCGVGGIELGQRLHGDGFGCGRGWAVHRGIKPRLVLQQRQRGPIASGQQARALGGKACAVGHQRLHRLAGHQHIDGVLAAHLQAPIDIRRQRQTGRLGPIVVGGQRHQRLGVGTAGQQRHGFAISRRALANQTQCRVQ